MKILKNYSQIGFKDVATAKVVCVKNQEFSRSHAHKIQTCCYGMKGERDGKTLSSTWKIHKYDEEED